MIDIPPYSPAEAHKLIADFEEVVRADERHKSRTIRPDLELIQECETERRKMFDRLTSPHITTKQRSA